jgi:ubiquinone/menaquinone biosynthesis C-methylase UbiE
MLADAACHDVPVGDPAVRAMWNANAAEWIRLSRAGFDRYRDLVNTPAFFAELPPIDGLDVLDVGCGEGHNTRLLSELGARVTAIDISELFAQAAATWPSPMSSRASAEPAYAIADAESLPFADARFDGVTAFMSVQDTARPETTLGEIRRVLQPGGFVQFSVLHPVNSTPVRRWADDDQGRRSALCIGGYFVTGAHTETWSFSAAEDPDVRQTRPFTITHAHRTLTGWISAIRDAGLMIDALWEPTASPEIAAAHPDVADTRIVPYFLHIRAVRTG